MQFCTRKAADRYHSWEVIRTIKCPRPLLVLVKLFNLFLSKPAYMLAAEKQIKIKSLRLPDSINSNLK
jgi:hypothetical protein